jgi:hypothetical protein
MDAGVDAGFAAGAFAAGALGSGGAGRLVITSSTVLIQRQSPGVSSLSV